MKRLLSSTLAAFVALTNPTWADSPVVVELFTSQGCSSCPPADKMLHALAERDDVIALALHVDYWDYIGWKDKFAQAKFSNRQRGYAVMGGRRSVYTPEMVVNGVTDVVGAKPMKLAEAISKHAAIGSPVAVSLERVGGSILFEARAQRNDGPYVVQMVHYFPLKEVKITRGENAGHTLSYANIASDWQIMGEWDGVTPLSLTADLDPGSPVVVIVQKQGFGQIVGAARLR